MSEGQDAGQAQEQEPEQAQEQAQRQDMLVRAAAALERGDMRSCRRLVRDFCAFAADEAHPLSDDERARIRVLEHAVARDSVTLIAGLLAAALLLAIFLYYVSA